jgi:ATP-binding cassette subfamily B protein
MTKEKMSTLYRVFRENFHLYWRRYCFAICLMLGVAISQAVSAYLLKDVMNVVFGAQKLEYQSQAIGPLAPIRLALSSTANHIASWISRDSAQLGSVVFLSLSIMLLFFSKGLCTYGAAVILNRIGNNIVARMQKRITGHLLDQSMRFFSRHSSSELMTVLNVGANATSNVMNQMIGRLQDLFMALGLVTTLFVLSPKLSLFSFLIFIPMAIGLSRIIKKVKQAMRKQQAWIVQVTSATLEGVQGIKVVKSYNLEKHMRQRFDSAIHGVENMSNKLARISERTSPLMESLGGIVIALVIFYSGYQAIVEKQEPGVLFAFVAAFLMAYEPIKRVARANVTINQALMGVSWAYRILDEDDRIVESKDSKALVCENGHICVNQVSFSYRMESTILRDVSLDCLPNSVTALVGPSGSGKSTVMNLIAKLYLVQGGQISIDDQNLNDVSGDSIRQSIAWVTQDTYLFDDTIENNIRLGREGATDEEIRRAAKMAHADGFIMEMPQGYQTRVGENGGQLSGGQKQRISIARAFLKDAKILLLDEATSALDSESEKQIQEALDLLMEGRTTVVIAHRFSTIRKASRIYVFDRGRVVASGSHADLMKDENGVYSSLYRLQFEPMKGAHLEI